MENSFLMPLRRLHGRVHEWNIRRKDIKRISKHVRSSTPNVIVPVTPEHTNLGDHAIVIAQIDFLKKCGYSDSKIKEISTTDYIKFNDVLKKKVSRKSFIAQLGGGNMGNQWLNEELLHEDLVLRFPKNKQIVFPQTIHFTPDNDGQKIKDKTIDVYDGKDNLILVARETASFDTMKQLYPNTKVILVPDIVLSATVDLFGVENCERKEILLCFRSDAERIMKDTDSEKLNTLVQQTNIPVRIIDTHSHDGVSTSTRNDAVKDKIEEFMCARLVITDRLHGLVFSAITGTPCIAFGNYNYKVKGTYEWIKHLPYIKYVDSVQEAEKYIPELLSMSDCVYDNTPLIPYYEKLIEVIKEHAEN